MVLYGTLNSAISGRAGSVRLVNIHDAKLCLGRFPNFHGRTIVKKILGILGQFDSGTWIVGLHRIIEGTIEIINTSINTNL